MIADKSMDVVNHSEKYIDIFPDKPLTKFKLAMPTNYMTDDVVHSYRMYYAGVKYRFANWKSPSKEPNWWQDYRKYVVENNLEATNSKDDGVLI